MKMKVKSYEAVDPGLYPCVLKNVSEVDVNKFGSPGEKEKNIQFVFESVDMSKEDGDPVAFFHRVRPIYGPDKSRLTILLDGMLGRRMTNDEAEEFDPETLKGGRFNVLVDLVEKNGSEYNNVLNVKAMKRATASTARRAATEPDPDEDTRVTRDGTPRAERTAVADRAPARAAARPARDDDNGGPQDEDDPFADE